ncbi:leucine-rich repeat protein [Bacteroides sp. OttesenSCG-928-N06]|nr:leucine-rich repeat protein [Bacteroides sp. OttesenSCG-928-N06]
MKKAIVLEGEIDQLSVTRVNDNGFANGDIMGVYIVDYQGNTPGKLQAKGNRANNVPFTFDEAAYKWNSPYDIYWKDDKTSIDVYGYYPYGSPTDITAYTFEVAKDQSKPAANGNLGGYEASDFLWGKAENISPTANVVRLPLRHRMSNARVTLIEGTGFANGEWAKLEKNVLVLNTKRNSLIDLSTGAITVTGEVATTGIIPAKTGSEYRAIVVPQTIAASTPLFSITVDGVAYSFKKNEAMVYNPGKMHNFSIAINKKEDTGRYEFVLAKESITAWENDLVSHEATAKEYVVIHVSEAGKLKEAIAANKKDYKQLQNLKITGKIGADDFYFMKDKMENLQALNLKEAIISAYQGYYGEYEEDVIPSYAFNGRGSLIHLILPDKLKTIGRAAFAGCTNITGSLIIPEGVISIEGDAFYQCKNMTGRLSLPTTLEEIGINSFCQAGFTCGLLLPSKLKLIEDGAFLECTNLYGYLHLPDALEHIGNAAFSGCSNLTGSIEIPPKVTTIGAAAFHGMSNLNGTLILHDGITSIGEMAFANSNFRGELILPKSLMIVGYGTFEGCDFSGELKLPAGLATIGDNAFACNWRLMGILEIPENVQSIGAGAFANCSGIEGVVISRGVENIQNNAFLDCFGIGSIVCKGIIPPYVQNSAFNGVPKDNFTLEVPETVVRQYQAAPGWSEFKRVSAHRELVCRPALATAINTQCTRKLVLDAEGDWEVVSMPNWCMLSATSGSKKTELTLAIKYMPVGSNTRSGEIVFKLKDKEYTTRCVVNQYDYQYAEDKIIKLKTATKGEGINLVFLGDGFNAEDISKGEYMKTMYEQVEHFFGIEPYSTYQDYFNVYTAIAVSPESGIGTINTIRHTKFETTFTGGMGLRCDYDAVFDYVLKMPTITKSNLHQSLVIVTPNSTDYGGICQMWEDGSAIAFCPMSTYGYPFDTRGVLQHEAGGHGFGKLGDEYIYHNAFIDFCSCTCCPHDGELNYAKSLGWFQNLSLTGKMHEVPWSHLIFDNRYSDIVDIFEGGFMHSRGVFRSEQNSCMNNNIPYFSAISREAIVKRIKEYAGEAYSFEEFVANDKFNAGAATRTDSDSGNKSSGTHQYAPVIHKGKPNVLK